MLYFTVTALSPVGFGDSTAKSETTRLVVTGQMIADLIILGLAIKVIMGAFRHGRQRRLGQRKAPGLRHAGSLVAGHRSRRPRSRARVTAWLRDDAPSLR